jgi:hypothetical protein
MPPTLIYSARTGRTWALYCEMCRREIAVDIIRLYERYDPWTFTGDELDRASCRDCGARLTRIGGYVIGALRFIGRWPANRTMVLPAWVDVPAF